MTHVYRCRNGGTIISHGEIDRDRLIAGVVAANNRNRRALYEREKKKGDQPPSQVA